MFNIGKPRTMLIILCAMAPAVILFIVCCSDGDDDDDRDAAQRNFYLIDEEDEENSNDDADESFGDVWIDPSTGLMWRKKAECCYFWTEAKAYCQSLESGGYNDWRLPTVSELRSLIRECPATESDGPCNVADKCLETDCRNNACNGCTWAEGPGPNGCYWPAELEGSGEDFWSSSVVENVEGYAWYVQFEFAKINFGQSTEDQGYLRDYVRCVR